MGLHPTIFPSTAWLKKKTVIKLLKPFSNVENSTYTIDIYGGILETENSKILHLSCHRALFFCYVSLDDTL